MLSEFFAGDFAGYFAALRASGALWLFVHVPKTAGSSLIAEASAVLQPAYNIDIDHTDPTLTYRDRFDAAVATFLARQARQPFRFCTGHIDARQAQMIRAAVPNLRAFTFLREPIARLVSDYRYQLSAMNTARAAFVAATPSFEAYVARPHVHNKMARSLAPRPLAMSGDVPGCVDHIMRNYAFVGLQEMYPLGVRALTHAMGQMRAPTAAVRVNDEEGLVLGAEDERALRALNAVDVGVYEAFARKWREASEVLETYLRKEAVLF